MALLSAAPARSQEFGVVVGRVGNSGGVAHTQPSNLVPMVFWVFFKMAVSKLPNREDPGNEVANFPGSWLPSY